MSDTPVRSRALTIALVIFFFIFGLSGAAWVVRIPQIREVVHVDVATLGILFLTGSIGAMLSLTAAGRFVARRGTRTTIALGFILMLSGGSISISSLFAGSAIFLGIGSFISGLGAGLSDVGVNVEGAALEKRQGRSLMPQLHGSFSLGTLAGALAGSLAISIGLPVTVQTIAINAVSLIALLSMIRFIPRGTGRSHGEHATEVAETPEQRRANWTNPRLVFLGLAIFGASVAEGGANDWLALAMVDDYKIAGEQAALTFAVLVGAMTIVRFSGGKLVDRFGRTAVLRTFGLAGILGVLLVILGAPNPFLAWTGAALWGAGVALAFPLLLSAAADGENSSGRVAVVTAFGYAAFLVAPPLLGFLGQTIGLLNMFWVFTGLIGLLVIFAGAAKPLVGYSPARSPH
jgi:fucose permease